MRFLRSSNNWFILACLVAIAFAFGQINPRPIGSVIFLQDDDAGPTFPVLRGVGNITAKAAGNNMTLPTGTVDGDFLVAFCETSGESLSAPTDWVEVACSPQTVGSSCPGVACSTLTMWTNQWNTGDNKTTADSGNHQLCAIVGFEVGTFDTSNPIDGCTGSTEVPATNSVTIIGATTADSFTRVLSIAAAPVPDANDNTQFDSEVNADLTDLAEIGDQCRNTGDGGCLWIVDGKREVAKALADTTGSQDTVTEREHIMIGITAPP